MVVIYEALTTAGSRRSSSSISSSSNNGRGGAAVVVAAARLLWDLLWVGPHHLFQCVLRNAAAAAVNNKNADTQHYDYGSNERAVVMRNVVTSWLTNGGLCWIVVWMIRRNAAAQRRRQQQQGDAQGSTAAAAVKQETNDSTAAAAVVVVVVVEWLQSMVLRAWRKRQTLSVFTTDRSTAGKLLPPLLDDDDQKGNRTALHKGACHCGAVQFQIRASPSLLRSVSPPDGSSNSNSNTTTIGSIIQYPRLAVPVEAFVLNHGRKYLQSYQPQQSSLTLQPIQPAHTFCRVCGVHLLQAVDPSAKELFVNAMCLQPPQIETKPVAATTTSKANSSNSRCGGSASTSSSSAKSNSSNRIWDDPELVVLPSASTFSLVVGEDNHRADSFFDDDAHDHHNDPEFTLTAVSCGTSSGSSMATSDHAMLHDTEDRGAPARSPETTGLEPRRLDTERLTTTTTTTNASASAVASPPREENEDDLNASFASSASSTTSTTDAQKEQLRKFLGKHVVERSNNNTEL